MKIAVIICGLVFDSQKALMKGIERKVRDLKDICSVFCIHGDLGSNESFVNGERMIFELPDISKFDGVIYVKNTFSSCKDEINLIKEVREKKIPCVCVDDYDGDFVNVTSDEEGSIFELTNHMIREHGCKRFYFVSGHEHGNDSLVRYRGFSRALLDNKLSFENKYFYAGDYQYRSGVNAVDYFLTLNEPMADCIICANDQMAVGVYMELKRRGYKVPKDVKITGVDYDFVSRAISTRLTTIKRQQYQKGTKAVDILHDFSEYKPGDHIVLPIALSMGESCGCKNKTENHNDVNDTLAVDRYEQTELNQLVKDMSVDFMSKTDYAPLIAEMRRYAYRMKPREMYLCLNIRPRVDIDYQNFAGLLTTPGDSSDYSEEVINLISCVDGEPARSGDKFKRSDLLPPVANGGREGVTYYYLPIHYMNSNYGYAILGESGDLVRNDFFSDWCASVSNAFENTRKIEIMEQMISILDKMWIYDTLTGIYNRAGFFKLSEPIVEACIREKRPVCVIFLDVDGLKKVNDSFGHDAGDNLIKNVAEVLRMVKHHGEIIMRYGGDEFVLLAEKYDDEKANACIASIEQALEQMNASLNLPYRMETSIGYTITPLSNKEELNRIIEDADREMYKTKKKKRDNTEK